MVDVFKGGEKLFLLSRKTYGPIELIPAELYLFERILTLAYQCTKKIIKFPEG